MSGVHTVTVPRSVEIVLLTARWQVVLIFMHDFLTFSRSGRDNFNPDQTGLGFFSVGAC